VHSNLSAAVTPGYHGREPERKRYGGWEREGWSALAAKQADPPDPRTSPWLALAAPIGKVAATFLIGQNLILLFAPLFFLLDLRNAADPSGPGGSLVLLFSDPVHLLAIADFVGLIGVVILAASVFLILFGLIRADRKVPADAFLLGVLVLACLAAWVPTMAYALGRARAVTTVDAVAATGGWSLAAVLLLAAALAYLFLCVRLENGARTRLGSFRWPIYAAVNVLGSAIIAGFFQSAAGGSASLDAFTLGLVLKVTLIPVLGVWAYRDLKDRFPAWAQLPVMTPPRVETPAPTPAPPTAEVPPRLPEARPVLAPPPPMGAFVHPLPPPPDD